MNGTSSSISRRRRSRPAQADGRCGPAAMAHPYDVAHASELHVAWCRDLAARMGVETTHQSGPQLRAVMLELRDALSAACVFRVADALPALERGIFLEGFRPDRVARTDDDAEAFQERVFQRVRAHHARVPSLLGDVFWLLSRKLACAEAATVFACLPDMLKPFWPTVPVGDDPRGPPGRR